MKYNSYSINTLPHHGGHFYPIQGPMNYYLSEFMAHLKSSVVGMVFNGPDTKGDERVKSQKHFRIEGPKFVQQINKKQTIKYGAILYIMVAVLAMPAGLCSHQNATSPFWSPIAAVEIPGLFDLIHDMVPAPEPEKQTEVEVVQKQETLSEPPFSSYILQASQSYGVDAALIHAVIMAESSYNPRAVSHRGAQGLMQLMPRTAQWLGVKDSFNPAHNIDGGVRYLRKLLDRFKGDVKLALAAYNAGSRHVRNYGGVPPFKATQIYIKKVLKYRRQYQQEMLTAQPGTTASI